MKLILQIATGIVLGVIGLLVLQSLVNMWQRQAYREQLDQAHETLSAKCDDQLLPEEERNQACQYLQKNINLQLEEAVESLKGQ